MTKRVAFLALPATMLALLPYSFGLSFYFVADDFRYLELAGQVQTPADILAHIQGACTRAGWPVVVFIFWLARSIVALSGAMALTARYVYGTTIPHCVLTRTWSLASPLHLPMKTWFWISPDGGRRLSVSEALGAYLR